MPSPVALSSHPHPLRHGTSRVNVGSGERLASAFAGGLLAYYGLTRGSLSGLLLAVGGGVLVFRGTTGYCPAFGALGIDTAEPDAQPEAIRIRETVTVGKPRGELYAYWRDVEHLPQFMHHLASVQHLDQQRSEWTARVPKDLGTIRWTAEITDDRPDEHIAWRSVPGSDVHNAGAVHFTDAPGDQGTEVHVEIEYRPPGGGAGATLARWFNPAFSQMIKEDVRRFKNLMEAGEVPTVDGQPTGPS